MYVAGVDEVGRGPLAGPLIAAAVILDELIDGIKDSKQLTPIKRRELAYEIKEKAICFAYGRAEVEEINALNIHHATLLAMKRAIEGLSVCPEKVLIDGIHAPDVVVPCYPVAKADSFVLEVSAASILAKVYRDEEMERMDELYPGYGFASHKGYSTSMHQQALVELGPCVIHRKNFSRVAAFAEDFSSEPVASKD